MVPTGFVEEVSAKLQIAAGERKVCGKGFIETAGDLGQTTTFSKACGANGLS